MPGRDLSIGMAEPVWLDFPGFGLNGAGQPVRVRLEPFTDLALSAAFAAVRDILPQQGIDEAEEDWLDRLVPALEAQALRIPDAVMADPSRRAAWLRAAGEILADRILFRDLLIEWQGVGAEGGDEAAPMTARAVRTFLDAHGGYARQVFRNWCFAARTARAAEGNGFALSPDGSAGEGASTAGAAPS